MRKYFFFGTVLLTLIMKMIFTLFLWQVGEPCPNIPLKTPSLGEPAMLWLLHPLHVLSQHKAYSCLHNRTSEDSADLEQH